MFVGGMARLPRAPRVPSRLRAYAPAPGAAVPYTLPAIGEIVHAQVGGNTFDGIRPPGPDAAQWTSRNFQVWGAGVFVPWYGARGAYFVGGASGGHNDGCNYYGAVWSVATGQWALLTPTNTIDRYFGVTGENHSTAETNGSPYYEVSGTTPADSVPAAAHVYRNQVPWALGANGSVLWVGRSAATSTGLDAPAVHQVALGASTLTYSRHTTNTSTRHGSGSPGWDGSRPVVGEYVYPIYTDQHEYTQLERYRPSTGVFDLWPATPFASPAANLSGAGWTFTHLDRYLVKRGSASDLYLFDTATPANGWVQVTTSGTMPASTVNLPAKVGSGYYWAPQAGGSSLTKLVPPADPVAGTWAFSSAAMSSGSFPAYPGATDAYTPTFALTINGVDYLGHCVGGAYGMHLCRPE